MGSARAALVALLLTAATAAQAQHPLSPEHCSAEVIDLAGLIACARLGDEGRPVLVAGIETVDVPARSFVEAGQTIGATAGPGGVIYLEVRKGNQAVDPFGIR